MNKWVNSLNAFPPYHIKKKSLLMKENYIKESINSYAYIMYQLYTDTKINYMKKIKNSKETLVILIKM